MDAIACYEALLAAEPAHPEANYGLATLFANLIVKTRRLPAIGPRSRPTGFCRSELWTRHIADARGELEAAVACFRQALDVDPKYVRSLVGPRAGVSAA